jgi:rhodanese-related sulfurtransferase
MDPRTAQSRGVTAGELLLVDVRSAAEYAEAHAPGSINVPLDQLASSVKQLSREQRDTAFVCAAGRRSEAAVALAADRGLQATDVPGGLAGWPAAGLPLDNDPKEHA